MHKLVKIFLIVNVTTTYLFVIDLFKFFKYRIQEFVKDHINTAVRLQLGILFRKFLTIRLEYDLGTLLRYLIRSEIRLQMRRTILSMRTDAYLKTIIDEIMKDLIRDIVSKNKKLQDITSADLLYKIYQPKFNKKFNKKYNEEHNKSYNKYYEEYYKKYNKKLFEEINYFI